MGLDFLVPIFAILVALVPVIGLTTIMTLRWGLKPFIETLAKELKGTNLSPDGAPNMQMVALLEQVELLTDEVRRLKEAQDFDSRLLEAKGPAQPVTESSPPES